MPPTSHMLTAEEVRALRERTRESMKLIAREFGLVQRRRNGRWVWSGRHAREVRVTGKLQGVGFESWICEQARGLAVSGWVENCDDGSFRAHLEGSRESILSLVDRMREGPPGARVDKVVSRQSPIGDFGGFDVRQAGR